MVDNAVTAQYLRRCAVDGDPLRDAALRAPYVEGYAAGVGGMLPRPLFVPEGVLRAAADDVIAIFDLIGSLPDRLFDGDAVRYAAALCVEERAARIALRDGLRPPPRYGRADLIFDGTRFQVVEANIGSEMGGCWVGEMSRGLLQLAEFRAFADEHRLATVDTAAAVAAMLRQVGQPVTGGRDPVVAVVEWTDGFATVPEMYRLFQVVMAQQGITVHLAEAPRLIAKDGKLYLDGEPIDIALRYFMLHEIAGDPAGEEIFEPIRRAHLDGGTLLFTHPQTNLYAYKDNLALLSDPRYQLAFSADERALVDRMLPWTRIVADGATQVDGETVDLRAYCLANRTDLIAKPHAGFGSWGTVAGWEVTDEEWAALIAEDSGNRYVVQRRVDPVLEESVDPQTGAWQEWLPIHGLFVTGGYGGDLVRALPAGRTAVVAGHTGARMSSVFSYPEGA